MKVVNGTRPWVSFSNFEGSAGFTRTPLGARLAYIPNKGGSRPPEGLKLDLDGQLWRVDSVGISDYIPTMLVLELRAIDG